MAIKFSKEQINTRIRFENPWWEKGDIDSFYNNMKRREYFHLFFPLIQESTIKRAVVLMGPRRVGKTVLLYHTIKKLIETGVNPKNICYFSIETPLYNGIALEELLHLYLAIHQKDIQSRLYILFDEIQYLKDWEIHLKSLVDSYHNLKFVVSGSAAAALKLKSRESGAGRFTDFILPPLTFHEFLSLTKHEDLVKEIPEESGEYATPNIKALNRKFIEYINFGGYPEVSLSETIQTDPGRYIRNDIIDKVLLRDLPSLYGIQNIQELNSLFTYIAYNSGNEMSLDSISQNAGVAKNTIRKYLTYLEAAFLIKVIHRIDQNGKKFKRANFFKVYLTNPSLRSALFSPIDTDDTFIGNMVETAIFAQWNHKINKELYYARWGSGEVDIVGLNDKQKPKWCVEIKWTNRYVEKFPELKALKAFCTKNKIETVPLVTTINRDEYIHTSDFECEFMPASLYCYTVGRNIISNKSRELRNISNSSSS